MKITAVDSNNELSKLLSQSERTFLLLYKSNSDKGDCAYNSLLELDDGEYEDVMFYSADVNSVRDIHSTYNIESAPSLMEFSGRELVNVYKGCNSADFYRSVITGGHNFSTESEAIKQKNVVLYSTPTCTWCNTIKNYFKENNVRFRDIDVSQDQRAAEEMVRLSGQQGVPQTNIEGQIIVGFDKKRIEELLNIGN